MSLSFFFVKQRHIYFLQKCFRYKKKQKYNF